MTEHTRAAAGDERWPRIAVGLTLASLAAGYTLPLELFVLTGGDTFVRDGGDSRRILSLLFGFLLFGFVSFVLIGLLAALPAVYVISLAEARRWRSPVLYAEAGAAVALFWAGVFTLLASARSLDRSSAAGPLARGAWALAGEMLMLSLPGLVGGLVYWWIAGRTAGGNRD